MPQMTLVGEGGGEGPDVLLLHGLGSCRQDWQPQVDGLQDRYCLWRCDLRGQGDSPRTPPYDPATLAADVARWLDERGLGAVHVVGLSLGAMVALELALLMPTRVLSLVLINGWSDLRLRDANELRRFRLRRALVRWLGPTPLAWLLAGQLFPGSRHRVLRRRFRRRFIRNNRGDSYLGLLDALVHWSVRERLPAIRCPVLLVSTRQDYVPAWQRWAQFRGLPSVRLVSPRGHHAWPAEAPAACNALLAAFLASCRVPKRDALLTRDGAASGGGCPAETDCHPSAADNDAADGAAARP